jgi:type I restriction enzyme R subunit
MTDEAHRSQYDIFALNMRNALPHAAFIGFTGTPLMVGEEKTREVFGAYVSVYNFKQSVDDNATVPLYYENRVPELQLTNVQFNEDMERLLEAAELDTEQERTLERAFSREYQLIMRDNRLEKIAEDLVSHFMGRGYHGKAMVISIDKATAIRMYDKVQKYWKDYIVSLKGQLATCTDAERSELLQKIAYMEGTDMAVVVSQAQNEIEDLKEKGVDIIPHRRRMVTEDLDTKFKDPHDPFRLVFVCAMWMTGFDVPSCSTIYLDKPMRNHTLMQTIARANRVWGEKVNGLIVDYVGMFRDLQRALAIYGSASGGGIKEGETPVQEKTVLVDQLRQTIEETTAFCTAYGVDVPAILASQGFERVKRLSDAVEAIIVNDEAKTRYLALANTVARLYKAILPDAAANTFTPYRALFTVLAEKIRSLIAPADIAEVMGAVETLLDASIAAEGYEIHDPGEEHRVDLSQIDFEALKEEFAQGQKRTEAEKLRGRIQSKLHSMVRLNKMRLDYLEQFQKMIDEYNQGSAQLEFHFMRLVEFAQELTTEEQRHMAENLAEEELAVFDLLTKPEMDLSEQEKAQIKQVARELLQTLKREKLVLDWRKRQQTRAQVKVTIEETLDRGLPATYDQALFAQKCELVYQHVYDSYFGQGRSIYENVA